MKVKELIEELNKYEQNADILVSSDEELNTIYSFIDLSYLGEEDEDNERVVIWGCSGSEVDL